MKWLLWFVPLLLSLSSNVKTVTSVTVTPHGAVVAQGDTLTYTTSCSYSDLTTDACILGNAGAATWTSYTTCYPITSSGVATWTAGSTCDPANTGTFPSGKFTAQGHIQVCYQSVCDNADTLAQHVGDTFYPYITPDYRQYQNGDGFGNIAYNLNVVVGSQPQIGLGFVYNNSGTGSTGTPGQFTCNWASSDVTKATVDRFGTVTAIAAGSPTITCNPTYSTNAVHGASTQSGWTYANGGNGINLVVVAPALTSRHWYVDHTNGGTYYDVTYNPTGQCNGLSASAYVSGTNQPCPVADIRYLYWYNPTTGAPNVWAVGPGDIVELDPSGTPYSPGYSMNQNTTAPFYPSNCGIYYGCYSPPFPSGTAAGHTILRGHNYASCTSDASKSKLLGDNGGKYMLNLIDSQYVDVQCVELTQQSDCGGIFTYACGGALNHAANDGIWTSGLTSNVTFTDVYVFGLAVQGWFGATGYNGVTATRLHIQGMPGFGINMDDNSWVSSNISVAGGLTMSNSIVEWTGCVSEHNSGLTYPYIECRDSSTNNGWSSPDGIGEGNTSGYWSFDKVIMRYNWQDGFDMLHSGMQYLSITNSQAYGNIGASFKMGPATTVQLINNQSVQNCQRMSVPVGDQPPASIVGGANYCRGNDWLGFNFAANGTYKFYFNSFVGYQNVIFDYGCAFGYDTCTPALAALENNQFLGFTNNSYNPGSTPGISEFGGSLPLWTVRDYNNWYNTSNCPSLSAHETCGTANPLYTSQPTLTPGTNQLLWDNYNFLPTPGSPMVHSGVAIGGVTTDINGLTRPNPPSLGSMEQLLGNNIYINGGKYSSSIKIN